MSATVCSRVIDRASAWGAVANTSSETSWVPSAAPPPALNHCTRERAPAWATTITQERWSAGSSRNQGSVSSIRLTLAVASAPAARSIRRRVAESCVPPDSLTHPA
ncbi:hypothetical protein Jiend_43740 [Micromonospora endophytica]|nr:hypothetical protein Jiend_43740 [Micromonospora endophytica]